MAKARLVGGGQWLPEPQCGPTGCLVHGKVAGPGARLREEEEGSAVSRAETGPCREPPVELFLTLPAGHPRCQCQPGEALWGHWPCRQVSPALPAQAIHLGASKHLLSRGGPPLPVGRAMRARGRRRESGQPRSAGGVPLGLRSAAPATQPGTGTALVQNQGAQC